MATRRSIQRGSAAAGEAGGNVIRQQAATIRTTHPHRQLVKPVAPSRLSQLEKVCSNTSCAVPRLPYLNYGCPKHPAIVLDGLPELFDRLCSVPKGAVMSPGSFVLTNQLPSALNIEQAIR